MFMYRVFGVLLLVIVCFAEAKAFSSLNEELDSYLKAKNFQGAVCILKAGKPLFKQAYGFANREHQILNSTKTIFRLGSLSKLFTAVAILQLQEKQLLNVHDSLDRYLPDYPHANEISLHHLLSHTSGIYNITDLPNLSEIQRHPHSLKDVIGHFKTKPTNFSPGSNCQYCDSGYILLGAVIEKVTGLSYEEYLKKELFGPLGMCDSYYESNHLVIPNRASGYTETGNHAAYLDMSLPHAAGALSSTIEDLSLWDAALKTEKILKKESLKLLYKTHGVGKNIAYGYGVRIGSQNEGLEDSPQSVRGHFGAIEGFKAAYIQYPDEDLTILMLSNVEGIDLESLQKLIYQIVKKEIL